MPQQNFYIPQWRMWNWKLISPVFVSLQLSRSRQSYRETENALAQLDDDVSKIEQEIRGVWASANVQMMRGFEYRLKEVGKERKRINFVRVKLREAIDAMLQHFPEMEKLNDPELRATFGQEYRNPSA